MPSPLRRGDDPALRLHRPGPQEDFPVARAARGDGEGGRVEKDVCAQVAQAEGGQGKADVETYQRADLSVRVAGG